MVGKLENVAIANALQLEAARHCSSCAALFLANFVICTAQTHELLFLSFCSKFWHRDLIQRPWFSKREQ